MWEYKTLKMLIQDISKDDCKGITFIKGDSEEDYLSYKKLYEKSLEILCFLQSKSIKNSDELVFQIEDNEKFISVFWACILGGIIPVPITVGNNDEHRNKLLRVWNILKKPHLITDYKTLTALEKNLEEEKRVEILEKVKPNTVLLDDIWGNSDPGVTYECKSDDIAFIQFSSGSTGEPKGVVLTHENLLSNINAILAGTEAKETNSTLSWMPLTHDMGLIGFHLTPMAMRLNQFIMPTSLFIRRPMLWLKKAHDHKITYLSSPNFGYRYFMSLYKPEYAADWDLSNVKLIFNGAEPISVDLCTNFLNLMSECGLKQNVMFAVYGLAEASLAVTFPPVGEKLISISASREHLSIGDEIMEMDASETYSAVKFVDVGYPVKDCSVRICDTDNNELRPNMVGRVLIRGKNVTREYYNNPELTTKLITSDGWLDTGDLGFFRNGRLVITGRAKDIIFVNGQNFYPSDIERVAEGIEGIELGEVAACSAFDKTSQSEAINIFLLFKKDLSEFAPIAIKLKSYIRKVMGVEVKNIIPLKNMPKTTSGKIERYKLAERFEKDEFSLLISETSMLIKTQYENIEIEENRNEIEEKLKEIWKGIFVVDHINTNDNFFELSGDSLLHSQFTAKIQQEFDVKISYEDFISHDSIAKMAAFILEKTTEQT